MKPHEERVVVELKELEEKIEKLLAFCRTETYWELPIEDGGLLAKQVFTMRDYAAILKLRIARFEV